MLSKREHLYIFGNFVSPYEAIPARWRVRKTHWFWVSLRDSITPALIEGMEDEAVWFL